MVPEEARVSFSFEGFPAEEHRLKLAKEGDRAGQFSTHIEPGSSATSRAPR